MPLTLLGLQLLDSLSRTLPDNMRALLHIQDRLQFLELFSFGQRLLSLDIPQCLVRFKLQPELLFNCSLFNLPPRIVLHHGHLHDGFQHLFIALSFSFLSLAPFFVERRANLHQSEKFLLLPPFFIDNRHGLDAFSFFLFCLRDS
ncbi:hypothetical protein H310_08911 [Aphanomyces invadans]|uniref:Uncharacterized protein n=1 Tax=Aphanomyces invadans TaxID=157072 RepID=A0A024TXU8_9STRA|nr:hypothetical protein H310_08911 [Aphanomyces invadans]ETV98182.1 hypothetical protein H310_08911 [Aphanomyces invadans]|eukprot:XP_008873057.1 hypothetical protein H310_08911 [Aphanomyces invadans]